MISSLICIHPVALELDLALAVVLTTGLEGEQLRVPRERLKCGQHVSYRHAELSVARRARFVYLDLGARRDDAPRG
jgi:hypothetical protein